MASFKPLELLLVTTKSCRLNSIWTHICNWSELVTDIALKLLCFEHPQSAETCCCCFPWEYEPVIQLLLWSKVVFFSPSLRGWRGKKWNYNSKLSEFCLTHRGIKSQLLNSILHQHKGVSGSHCLSGNQFYHSLLLSLETYLHFFRLSFFPSFLPSEFVNENIFWGATGWKHVNLDEK